MKFKILEDYLDLEKNEIVHEFNGVTYGCVQDDEFLLEEECLAVSREKGESLFIVFPKRVVEEI